MNKSYPDCPYGLRITDMQSNVCLNQHAAEYQDKLDDLDLPPYHPFKVNRHRDQWVVRCDINGKKMYFGTFRTNDDAVAEAMRLKGGSDV